MSSSIPAALPALMTMMTNALPVNSTVWFGRPLGVFQAGITLQINEITSDQQPAALGPDYKREETFEFHCALSSFAGDNNYVGRLQEVYTQLAAIEIAIGNNPTLNGTVRFAEIGMGDYLPETDAAGKTLGTLNFEIRCSQRITSLT